MVHELAAFLLVMIFVGLSQAAGIGGGPIINVILMVMLGLDSKHSMNLTYVMLMGGSFASMLKNRNKKKPMSDKPLIDYNLIMLCLPMMTTGSIIGAIINHFTSELILTILFTILLVFLSYNSYSKYRESEAQSRIYSEIGTTQMTTPYQSALILNPRVAELQNREKEVYPADKLRILLQIFIYSVVLLMFRGTHSHQSLIGFAPCGFGSWLCILTHLGLSYLYSKSAAIKAYNFNLEKDCLGICNSSGTTMSQRQMYSGMIAGMCAGLLGGMLGLGGAIILVPIWLNSGVHKDVAVATSGPLIFFTATISTILVAIGHHYNSFWLVCFYFVLSFTGSYLVKGIKVTLKNSLRLIDRFPYIDFCYTLPKHPLSQNQYHTQR